MDRKKELCMFYKKVLAIALPIMVQNGISNFVGFLDNIMIGKVGTEQMTGVGIVNQLMFVFNLCIFGAISGAGIFTAQFYGQGNDEGVKETFRFKLVIASVIFILASGIFCLYSDQLISFYLNKETSKGDVGLTLQYGKEYLFISIIGMLPYAIENCYSFTLRETGKPIVPMISSFVAVFVNLCLNYLLIYGKFGCPTLGVKGAAIATVVSRFVQAGIVVVWTHRNKAINSFIVGAYKTLKIKKKLAIRIIKLGFPLLLNETLWAAGIATQMQALSIRGLEVVAALNINSTINNVFNITFVALGDAVAIIVGQMLGANKLDEAKKASYRIIIMSVVISSITGIVLYLCAPLFPQIYKTEKIVKEYATDFIRVAGLVMPVVGFLHATYFTIRSGGKTIITFLFDSCFLWVVVVPVAYFLARHTSLGIVTVFLLVSLLDSIKAIVGFIILKSGVWAKNITS